jgi:hypothetical protein
MKPTTHVLVKLFAYRFYKAHSGLLLFFFVTVVISFFFVNVLNETHLTEEDRIRHNLLLTLTFIESPTFTLFIFAAWLIFMIKSWSYTADQLRLPQHQFLFYSLNAQSKKQRFSQWSAVQTIIALPLAIYALFALTIGLIYGHYLIPVIILCYIAILVVTGAAVCIRLDNTFIDHNTVPWTMNITRPWPKPFFTLPLYHLLHRQKITLLITKLLSASLLAAGVFLLPENMTDSRVIGILALGIATVHAFIVYQAYTFSNTYLIFWRNFPHTNTRRLALTIMTFLVLVLPELLWLLFHHTPWHFTLALVLIIGILILFHTLLDQTTTTKQYLVRVFYLFIISFVIILFNLLPILAPITLLTAIIRSHIQYKLEI